MTTTESSSRPISRASLGLPPFVAPEENLESKITAVFAEVFNLDQVGATDDFFDLGGDSLLAEVLAMRISEQTGRDFPLSNLALQGSPRKIAALLHAAPSAEEPTSRSRPPIFIVHGRGGTTLLPPAFFTGLAKGQEVHMFQIPGLRGDRPCDRVEDLAAAYIAEIERIHPEGPVLLAAFCVGGLIAVEMAMQLIRKGRPPLRIVLLDPGNPYKRNKAKREAFAGRKFEIDPGNGGRTLWDYLPPIGFLDRWRPGSLTNDTLRFRRKFELKQRQGVRRYLPNSIPAKAKLYAAYEHYQPSVFHGPVTIMSSKARDDTFRDPTYGWTRLLPNREIHLAIESHDKLTGPETARYLQSLFDAALAESSDRPPARTRDVVSEATPALSSHD